MDGENALELFKEAVNSGKLPVHEALEAVLLGLNGADKETIKQVLLEAVKNGISLDSAKKMVQKMKKNSNCF